MRSACPRSKTSRRACISAPMRWWSIPPVTADNFSILVASSAQPGSRPGRGFHFAATSPPPFAPGTHGLHTPRVPFGESPWMEAIARRGVLGVTTRHSLPRLERPALLSGAGRVVPGSSPGGTTEMIPDYLQKKTNLYPLMERTIVSRDYAHGLCLFTFRSSPELQSLFPLLRPG